MPDNETQNYIISGQVSKDAYDKFDMTDWYTDVNNADLISMYMAKGGKTQGYDDREDERLGMEDGKLASKDFIGSRKHRKHSRRDDARFEERGKMAKGGRVGHSKEDKARFAKPAGWRWKEIAVTKRSLKESNYLCNHLKR